MTVSDGGSDQDRVEFLPVVGDALVEVFSLQSCPVSAVWEPQIHVGDKLVNSGRTRDCSGYERDWFQSDFYILVERGGM